VAVLNPLRVTAAVVLVLIAGAMRPAVVSTSQALPLTEAQAKATLLYNLPYFVEWPEDRATSPIVVGVAGAGDVVEALRQLVGRGQRPLGVRPIADDDDGPCQVLFVPAEREAGSAALLSRAVGRSVLTVGDAPGFTRRGGVIRIYFEHSRLRFDINQRNAERARLRISSKLLALAVVVER
jgi:hypothetical protein